MLSRNFTLQKVGDFNWLKKHYNFQKIAFAIDELVILNVTRNDRDINMFAEAVKEVISNVFIPVSVGGGIRSLSDADLLLKSGADKIILNTPLYSDKKLVNQLVKKYGSQFVVGSVDYKIEDKNNVVFIENGSKKVEMNFSKYLNYLDTLNIGEIYLNSIDRDGTGQGFDLINLNSVLNTVKCPLIIAGGAGNELHFIEALKNPLIDAVATANLFNFIGDSLPRSREKILKNNIKIANWI